MLTIVNSYSGKLSVIRTDQPAKGKPVKLKIKLTKLKWDICKLSLTADVVFSWEQLEVFSKVVTKQVSFKNDKT